MWTGLGTLALTVAALPAAFLLFIGVANESGRDGGRAMATVVVGVPFAACLLVAFIAGLAKGGFDWVLPALASRGPRAAIVLLVMLCGVLALLGTLALGSEPRSQVPWALWPLLGWAHWLLLPALLLAPALALFPGLRASWPTLAWQGPLAALGIGALLVGAGLLVQLVQWSVQEQQARIERAIEYDKSRDRMMLEKVQQADPVQDFVQFLPHTSPFEEPEIRELALAKLRSHPDLNGALTRLLHNAWAEEAFTFLASHDPPDAAALAEPVRDGVLSVARRMRERVRDAHTLRPDDYEHDVKRVIATVDRYAAHGVDYAPAMRELRRAFDEPRRQAVDFTSKRLLDAWLKKHARPA